MSDGPPAIPEPKRRPAEYLILNLSFPGVGSYQSGCRIAGMTQAAIAGMGFVLTNIFAIWFCRLWYVSGEFPVVTLMQAEVMPQSWVKPFLVGLAGVALYVAALVWAIITSATILRRARS